MSGRDDPFDYIPVDSNRVADTAIYYRTYTGESDVTAPEQRIGISTLQGAEEGNFSVSDHVVRRTFLFGTDRYGRDLLSRIVAGTRVTFSVGLVAVLISLFVGMFFGSLAGYFRGRVDGFVLWLINVIWSVPTLLLVISISLVLGKGFGQVFIAVGLTLWVDVARIVRSQLFSIRELEFIAAGRALGFGSLRIIGRHMLPNVIGPVLVVAASNFSTAILLEAGLSFLGIGAQPPTPSWGSMIKENYGYIIIPGSAYLALLPGMAIMLLTMAFTFVANGLRDAVDAKTQVSLV
jgi:peptide/nickel transport system permease protein